MCTVSVVPRDGGFRLMCNRDERLSRPPALPPRSMTTGGVWTAYPIDPPSRGTWIGVNEAGVALALLNRSRARQTYRPGCTVVVSARSRRVEVRSRGEIVPGLIGATDLDGVRAALRAIRPDHFEGFRLVAAWRRALLVATSDRGRVEIATARLARPHVFTSSSLGDACVEEVRVPLFRDLVVRAVDSLGAQRTFHDHRWPGRTELSVHMCRHDARTVSRTTVDVEAGRISLTYEPLAGGHS